MRGEVSLYTKSANLLFRSHDTHKSYIGNICVYITTADYYYYYLFVHMVGYIHTYKHAYKNIANIQYRPGA